MLLRFDTLLTTFWPLKSLHNLYRAITKFKSFLSSIVLSGLKLHNHHGQRKGRGDPPSRGGAIGRKVPSNLGYHAARPGTFA
jgi:hypothetical protein